LSRISDMGDKPPMIWPNWSMEEIDTESINARAAWHRFMSSLAAGGLERFVDYQNLSGNQFRDVLSDIMTHVINHSTHHRAQIAKTVREAGLAPPLTDYIFYLRR